MSADPREIAFALLESGAKKKFTLDRAIETATDSLAALSPKDRSLCNAMVFGVLRHQGRLDHIIRHCSQRPVANIDQRVLTLIRLGIFQLVCLERIPDYAAIHSTMELAKKKTGKKAAGFVNAVLRKAADIHTTIALPDKKQQFTLWLTASCSIPGWLAKRWTSRFGPTQTEHLCRTLLEIPPVTLRTNTLAIQRKDLVQNLTGAGFTVNQTAFSTAGIELSHPGQPVISLPGYDQGHFQVQDEAAQLVTDLLDPKPGERILDACAGLGTKTCHMGQRMENKGEIIANDPDAGKQQGLKSEAARLGIHIIRPVAFDMTRAGLKELGGYFDRILVDAPCTGLGVIRRNPDTKWKRSPNDMLRMAAQQKKILNAAANLVAPGGVLVYAVCSCEPEENEGVITHFLNKRKDFSPDPQGFKTCLPGFASESDTGFQLKTFPDHTGMDGFFTARMRRKSAP